VIAGITQSSAATSATVGLIAGVELGGTQCRLILGTCAEDVRAEHSVPTRDPAATLGEIGAILDAWRTVHGRPAAIGLASFGPIELRRDSPRYGRIGATPKPGWANVDVSEFFLRRFALPVHLETDVTGAALAEARWGDARGLADIAYVTVGTGVGVGLVVNGAPLLACHHPELGHARIVRLRGDLWPGICGYHGDCIEGLASGPAIEARCGAPPASLPRDSPVWDGVVHALAQLAHLIVVSVAPQRILLGGGVLSGQPHLLPRIRRALVASLNGYLALEELGPGLDRYLVPAGLGARAGVLGALAVGAGRPRR